MIEELGAELAGRYTIEREIGAGGMATVYLAHDVKHQRRVAIKVLTRELAASVGAARFLQEIRIAAQLQHPHILGLIDSGHVGDTIFYVMPFVEGHSLRERLIGGQKLPVAEAVRIAREIADGLCHAHAHGVVHRDIKPENVMLSGRHALIVDFGVAKGLTEAADAHALTTIGITLGTPVYMAPEQASADPHIDHRADIYAVGVLLYEMLAGQPPFTGMSTQQLIRAHITRDPEPPSTLRPALPHELEHVVMKCLAKDPADRWQTAEALYLALEPFSTTSGETSAERRAPPRRSRVAYVAGGVVLAAGLAAAGWKYTHPTDRSLAIGKAIQLTSDEGLEIEPNISPDGKLVAYAAGNSQRMRIFIRPVAGGRTFALSDDSASVEIQPRWSPDGNQLLFLSRNSAYVSPALGGSEKLVAPGTGDVPVTSVAWAPDGRDVVLVRSDSVLVQSLDGAAVRVVGTGSLLSSCAVSPERAWIACISGNPNALVPGFSFGNLAPSDVVVFPFTGGAPTTITEGKQSYQSPVWATRGSTLFVVSNRDGPRDVYAFGIGSGGRANGAPARATTGLNAQTISLSGGEGQLAYSVYTAKANIWSLPIPKGTMVAAVTAADALPITSGSQVIELITMSFDLKSIVYDSDINGHADLYRLSLAGGSPEMLVHDSLAAFAGELSPDGREVVYHAFGSDRRRRFFVKNLSTNAVTRVADTDMQETSPRWSPDGRALVGWDQRGKGGVFVVPRDVTGKWGRPRLVSTEGTVPSWSPDGRSIAFVDLDGSLELVAPDSSARRAVYRPAAGNDAPLAQDARWSVAGDVVYAKGRDRAGRGGIWAIPVGGGAPRLVARLDDPRRPSDRPDFTSDATRFFITMDDRQSDVWVANLVRR